MRDAQKIAHEARGAAAAPAVYGTASHDVLHYQEVVDEPLDPDKVEFFVKTAFDNFIGTAVAPGDSRAALLEEKRVVIFILVHVIRKDGSKFVPFRVTGRCDPRRVFQGLRAVGKMGSHLPGGLQPSSRGGGIRVGKGAQSFIEGDRPREPVQRIVRFTREMNRVGRDRGNPETSGSFQQHAVRGTGRDFQVAFETALKGFGKSWIGGQNYDVSACFRKIRSQGKILSQMAPGDQVGDYFEAERVLCQDHRGCPVVFDQASDYRLDSVCARCLQKIYQSVKSVRVGQREMRET